MHGGPLPHLQVPIESHVFDDVSLHVVQVDPETPHVASERTWQVPWSSQQPSHDVPSHTHRPPTHRWPAAHFACPPQLHCPAVQPSASVPHAVHAPPPVPHVVADAWLQVVPEQQPAEHTQPLHAPPLQVSVLGQAVHACPPLPHAVSPSPVWHLAPLQHPVQDRPGGQAGRLPQAAPSSDCV